MTENKFTNWLHKELKQHQQEKEKVMAKVKEEVAMVLNAEQKKALLDIFNAGNDFSQSYRESGIKYITAWEIEKLLDLLDDMKDLYGIAPKTSEHVDNSGNHYPSHWADHVWSDDPRAWKRED
jgi:ribosome assembly protein YihI (activator of Der GTPase)